MLCSYRTFFFFPPFFKKKREMFFKGFCNSLLKHSYWPMLMLNCTNSLLPVCPALQYLARKRKQYMYLFILFPFCFVYLNNHFVVCRPKGVDALGCTDFMRFLFLMHYFFLGELYSRERKKRKPFPGLHRKAQLSLDTRRFGMMYITSLHLPP